MTLLKSVINSMLKIYQKLKAKYIVCDIIYIIYL